MFEILYRDADFVAIDKPPGFHVHQPEMTLHRVAREQTVLYQLRQQIGEWLYPVHRIDVATSGVLLFALNKKTASQMGALFTAGKIEKKYRAIARGLLPDSGTIDIPLELDSTGDLVDAQTLYWTKARVELPYAVGKRHVTARYSLLEVHPKTGRYHQIRRHLARLSHPLIGDRAHGDSHHNRFFREKLDLGGLWLRATHLQFFDPRNGSSFELQAPPCPRWQNATTRLGFI